jgi:DNA-binding FrmR family transcriptional regulator
MHLDSHEEKRAIKLRLRKIAGQVAAIEKMVEEDKECPDVLMQIVSVRKALKSLGEVLIRQHTHECLEHTPDPEVSRRKMRELMAVLERYVE